MKRTPFKRKAAKNAANAAEKRYMGKVAELHCAVCRRLGIEDAPAIVHHQRTDTGAMRASHYRTCPLCPIHHQFSGIGVHDMGRLEFKKKYGFSEVDLIEETRTILFAFIPVGQ